MPRARVGLAGYRQNKRGGVSNAHLHQTLLWSPRTLPPSNSSRPASPNAPRRSRLPAEQRPPAIVEQQPKQQHLHEGAARQRKQSCGWKGGARGRKGGPAAGCRPFAIAPRSSAQGMPASGPRTYLLGLPAPMSAMGGTVPVPFV